MPLAAPDTMGLCLGRGIPNLEAPPPPTRLHGTLPLVSRSSGQAGRNPPVVFSKLHLPYVRDCACRTLLGSATCVHTPNQMGSVCFPAPGWE